jgi:hypothetical protein
VGENALQQNIVLTVTGATEFRDDVRFNRNDHIVDFKTAIKYLMSVYQTKYPTFL